MILAIQIILALIWAYILYVLKRAKLNFWLFLVGSFGLFIFMMIWVRPLLTEPLARVVAAMAGAVGGLTGTFAAYFRYGIIFIQSAMGSITLKVDFECSGIIEIMAFLSLLIFFQVYTLREKLMVGVAGVLGIMLANTIRIIAICEIIYFGGVGTYFIAHAIVGRLIFYSLSVLLYFFVFTKPQIVRITVGKFKYGDGKQAS